MRVPHVHGSSSTSPGHYKRATSQPVQHAARSVGLLKHQQNSGSMEEEGASGSDPSGLVHRGTPGSVSHPPEPSQSMPMECEATAAAIVAAMNAMKQQYGSPPSAMSDLDQQLPAWASTQTQTMVQALAGSTVNSTLPRRVPQQQLQAAPSLPTSITHTPVGSAGPPPFTSAARARRSLDYRPPVHPAPGSRPGAGLDALSIPGSGRVRRLSHPGPSAADVPSSVSLAEAWESHRWSTGAAAGVGIDTMQDIMQSRLSHSAFLAAVDGDEDSSREFIQQEPDNLARVALQGVVTPAVPGVISSWHGLLGCSPPSSSANHTTLTALVPLSPPESVLCLDRPLHPLRAPAAAYPGRAARGSHDPLQPHRAQQLGSGSKPHMASSMEGASSGAGGSKMGMFMQGLPGHTRCSRLEEAGLLRGAARGSAGAGLGSPAAHQPPPSSEEPLYYSRLDSMHAMLPKSPCASQLPPSWSQLQLQHLDSRGSDATTPTHAPGQGHGLDTTPHVSSRFSPAANRPQPAAGAGAGSHLTGDLAARLKPDLCDSLNSLAGGLFTANNSSRPGDEELSLFPSDLVSLADSLLAERISPPQAAAVAPAAPQPDLAASAAMAAAAVAAATRDTGSAQGTQARPWSPVTDGFAAAATAPLSPTRSTASPMCLSLDQQPSLMLRGDSMPVPLQPQGAAMAQQAGAAAAALSARLGTGLSIQVQRPVVSMPPSSISSPVLNLQCSAAAASRNSGGCAPGSGKRGEGGGGSSRKDKEREGDRLGALVGRIRAMSRSLMPGGGGGGGSQDSGSRRASTEVGASTPLATSSVAPKLGCSQVSLHSMERGQEGRAPTSGGSSMCARVSERLLHLTSTSNTGSPMAYAAQARGLAASGGGLPSGEGAALTSQDSVALLSTLGSMALDAAHPYDFVGRPDMQHVFDATTSRLQRTCSSVSQRAHDEAASTLLDSGAQLGTPRAGAAGGIAAWGFEPAAGAARALGRSPLAPSRSARRHSALAIVCAQHEAGAPQ
uniref:Uncharacterized protein n=1 Tax=Chlamydomonas leiostraca TaxID=1034604 RepID=A0A7S0R2P6_9CHLO|mmetsp:Transcript_12376/g.30380  ORF Transcript_12376/g.30380 Transcript_12376/m.30380 type:complete len:1010 (+) Transcript_12376:118-3147(+)|eukprot:CAMPEP_0202857782 /NCGR_PEP_ID=MMETSP1391-20130828/587_1 /ASSEMBLY_ACC=CAM_ASM_000867 /TAXON_ID=1034604 /ORGANISM="Chlamydomonas leiostraca, Strain SAG 11-49" /LENGTH=1009 /DNA_ID=CAMNT_0049536629 /DNA_START=87 /DNA_END=3116 /DNA_ORIENTATION=-